MRRIRLELIVALLVIVGLFALLRGAVHQSRTKKLAVAVRNGDVELARWLIERGADVNGRDEDGDLILMAAVRFLNEQDEEMVRLLEEKGAKTDDATKFMTAAFLNRTDVIEHMLQNGLDPNVKDRDGDTALSCAAQRGNVETVEVLLKHGTNPNTINQNGYTVLDWAAQCRDAKKQKEIVALLKKHGVKGLLLVPRVRRFRQYQPGVTVPN